MVKNKLAGKIDHEVNKKVEKDENLTDLEDIHKDEDTVLKEVITTSEFIKNNDENQISFPPKGLPANGHGTAFELRVVMLSCMNAFRNCDQNREFEQINSNIRNNSSTTNSNVEQQHQLLATASNRNARRVTNTDRYEEFYLAPGLLDACAFDDVAFIYKKQYNKHYQCVLIQAKHGKAGKITKEELNKSDDKCNFGIRKYFKSYVDVKNALKKNAFASDLLTRKHIDTIFIDCVIICSNLQFADGLVNTWFDECDVNFLLNMEVVYQKAYKFKHIYYCDKNSEIDDVIKELMGSSAQINKVELKDFLDCLMFVVGFPETNIIDTVVSNDFNTRLSQKSLENKLAICFQGWLIDRITAKPYYITNVEIKNFLITCNSSFNELYLAGIMSEFKLDIKLYKLQIENNTIFENFIKSDERYIYCPTPLEQNLRLTTIQVYSLLSSIVNESKIFIISQKVIENVRNYLMLSTDIYLIIESEEDTTNFEIVKEIIKKTLAKLIVVFTSSVYIDETSKVYMIPPLQYDNISNLQEKKIIFQGKDVYFKDLIANVPEEYKSRLFTPKILYELLKPTDMKLRTTYQNTDDIYIHRVVECSCNLDINKLLDKKNKEFFSSNLFIIENMKTMPGKNHPLLEYITTLSSVEAENSEGETEEIIFLILDDQTNRSWESSYSYENTAADLRGRFKRSYIHFVELSENESQNKLQCLLRYSSQLKVQIPSSSVHISGGIETYETARLMVRDFIDSQSPVLIPEDKFALIKQIIFLHADPGVGKSTFVTNNLSKLSRGSAAHVLNTSDFFWKIHINLRKYKTYIDEHELKELKNLIGFLSVVESHSENIKLFIESFLEYILNNSSELHSILLVLDGYDEIDRSQQQKILDMILFILDNESMQFVYVLITSRSYAVHPLENELGYYAYKLLDFSSDKQQDYIERLWSKEKPSLPSDRIQAFSKKLVEKLNSSKAERDLLGTPLLCYIAAKIFSENVSYDDDSSLEKRMDVLNFYDGFIKHEYDVYRQTQQIQRNVFDEWISYRANELHRYLSLYCLFPVMFQKWYGRLDRVIKNRSDYDVMNGIGIVQIVESEDKIKIYFAHQTFAEYYVAQFFLHALTQNVEEKVLFDCQLFLRNEIFKRANSSIRFFLTKQLKLLEDKTVHERWNSIQSSWLFKPSRIHLWFNYEMEAKQSGENIKHRKHFDQIFEDRSIVDILKNLTTILEKHNLNSSYIIEKVKSKGSELVWTDVVQYQEMLGTIGDVFHKVWKNSKKHDIQVILLECANFFVAQLIRVPCKFRRLCLETVFQRLLLPLKGETTTSDQSSSTMNDSFSISNNNIDERSVRLLDILEIWRNVYKKIDDENMYTSTEKCWSKKQRNELEKHDWLFSNVFPHLFIKLDGAIYEFYAQSSIQRLNDNLADVLFNEKEENDAIKSQLKEKYLLESESVQNNAYLKVLQLPDNKKAFKKILDAITCASEENLERVIRQELTQFFSCAERNETESGIDELTVTELIGYFIKKKRLDNKINNMIRKRRLNQTEFINTFFFSVPILSQEQEFQNLCKLLTQFSEKIRHAVELWFINHHHLKELNLDGYHDNRNFRLGIFYKDLCLINKLKLFTMPMARQLVHFLNSPKNSYTSGTYYVSTLVLKPLLSALMDKSEEYIENSALVYIFSQIFISPDKLIFSKFSERYGAIHPYSYSEVTAIVQLIQKEFKSFAYYKFPNGALSDAVLLLLSLAKAYGLFLINDATSYKLLLVHPSDIFKRVISTYTMKFHKVILDKISEFRLNDNIRSMEATYYKEQIWPTLRSIIPEKRSFGMLFRWN